MSPQNTPPPLPSSPPPFVPPVPPPSANSEIVSLVVDKVEQKTGVFSKQAWKMLVTSTRLIFVLDNKTKIDYSRQDPGQSLAENPANFALPLDEVQGIEVYRGDFESNAPDSMVVKTPSDKMTFLIKDAYRTGQNLKKVLGNKVK